MLKPRVPKKQVNMTNSNGLRVLTVKLHSFYHFTEKEIVTFFLGFYHTVCFFGLRF